MRRSLFLFTIISLQVHGTLWGQAGASPQVPFTLASGQARSSPKLELQSLSARPAVNTLRLPVHASASSSLTVTIDRTAHEASPLTYTTSTSTPANLRATPLAPIVPEHPSPKKAATFLAGVNGHSARFIENRGQFDPKVKFRLTGNGPTLWLTNQGIVFDALRAKDRGRDSGELKLNSEHQPHRPFQSGIAPKGLPSDSDKIERLVFSDHFIGANSAPEIEVSDCQPGSYAYFFGKE